MGINLRSIRAAWNALIQQGHTGTVKATGAAATLQHDLRQRQLVEESNRLERISGVGPVANRKRGGLTLILRPATGAIDLVELNCNCGNSQAYTRDEFDMYLGAGRKAICEQCKRIWDFAQEARICLKPSEVANEEPLKPHAGFFQLAAEHGLDLTPADYTKGADGNYWLHIAKTRHALSLLDYAPSTLHQDESGPVIISTAGPEPKVEWETYDPEKSGAGFGSHAAQRSLAALPTWWLEKRERAELRHELAYGKDRADAAFEAEVRKRMKPILEEREKEIEEEIRVARAATK